MTADTPIHVIVRAKGTERYVFMYRERYWLAVYGTMRLYEDRPDLDWNATDTGLVVLEDSMRRMADGLDEAYP